MASSTTNGDLAPPTHADAPDSSAHKRKRDNDGTSPAEELPHSNSRLKLIQRDFLEVLDRHDAHSSFTKHPLPATSSIEPAQKKARLTEPHSQTTSIASRLRNCEYDSLQQLEADATAVCEDVISEIRTTVKEREASMGGRPSIDQLKYLQRAQAFKALVKELVDKEQDYVETHEPSLKQEESGLANGENKPGISRAGSVLTLFGNAPTPKQLFSSMQNMPTGPIIKSELPIEEMSLPNGIAATKVMPSSDAEKEHTFEDSFAPPYSLAPLNPPKHKKPAIRDNKITWEFKDPVQRNRKGGYTVQPLTVGAWLSYGGVEDGDSNSTREKRKERSRALSGSSDMPDRPNGAATEEVLAKEEEALFRKAYSSFAPSCDNSNVIVPEETKNAVWWNKVGARRYTEAFAIDPALSDESEHVSLPPPPLEEPAQHEDFSNILNDLEELEKVQPEPGLVRSKTDIEQVLREISELLETLASHQRIRNATIPTARDAVSRTPLSPAPAVTSKVNRPDEPSDEEYTTYSVLQRELAYLIMKLPPYAVAKLNADRLSELSVSKLIRIHRINTKGTLEEDLVTRQAKLSAIATATSIANLARPNSSAGQHYSTTASRTPAIGQAANTRYGQQHGSTKTPSVPQFQRQTSGQSSYNTPTTASLTRPSYVQPSQWNRPGATQPGYGQASGPGYYSRPTQTPGGYGHYNHYNSTPQQQRYNAQPTSQYQQQRSMSQNPALNAASYQTNAAQTYNRTATASPAKGYPAVSMAPAAPQQRAIYPGQQAQQHPGSGRATPTGYPSQPNTPVNGFRPPPGIAPRPNSSTPQPPTLQPNGTS